MPSYRILNRNIYQKNEYSIVPIRMEDRYDIMKWRNEQIYHLRQNKRLTVEDQDEYFTEVVAKLYTQDQPDQMLFSYLENNICIGYGGLVHINWIDNNAEISFILDTNREKEEFHKHWTVYLGLIEEVAFKELGLHKIYTYAFDLRPHLYAALESSHYQREATLKEHCLYNEKFSDVVLHSKIIPVLTFRRATSNDINLIFTWANNSEVRANSLNPLPISWTDHVEWFNRRLNSQDTYITIFLLNHIPIGQVRLDRDGDQWIIDFSIDEKVRGQGWGKEVINSILNQFPDFKMIAFVKPENIASIKVFESLDFLNKGFTLKGNTKLIKFTR